MNIRERIHRTEKKNTQTKFCFQLKDTLSSLRQFLITQRPLEIMEITFYFTLKALFVNYLSWLLNFLLFIVCQVESYWDILKLSCRTFAFTSYKGFSEIKKRSGTSLPHFLHDFWKKMLLLLYSINWPNFIVWSPLLREILGSMCMVLVCWPDCDVINFWN